MLLHCNVGKKYAVLKKWFVGDRVLSAVNDLRALIGFIVAQHGRAYRAYYEFYDCLDNNTIELFHILCSVFDL